jgi:hypothetical protein
VQIALSSLSFVQRFVLRAEQAVLVLLNGRLLPGLRWTMGEVDTRLPLMERGLAVWSDRGQRFYPLETIRAYGNALIDVDLGLAIGVDPTSGDLFCLPTGATGCNWQGTKLVLSTSGPADGMVLYDARGTALPVDAGHFLASPTCWYSFAFTFPGGELYV